MALATAPQHNHVDAGLLLHGDALGVHAQQDASGETKVVPGVLGGRCGIEHNAGLFSNAGGDGEFAGHSLVEKTQDMGMEDGAADADLPPRSGPADKSFHGGAPFLRAVAGEAGRVEAQLVRPQFAQKFAADVGAQSSDALEPYLKTPVVMHGGKGMVSVHLYRSFLLV